MLRRLSAIVLLLQTALFSCEITYASAEKLAISAKSSSLGLGGELTAQIAPNINTRFGANAFNLDLNGKLSDIEYDFGLDLLSFSAFVDWYPFKNSFHISGGILVNESEIGLRTTPASSLTIGSTTYTPAEIGTLSGTLSFNNIAPYVGIGWGNAFDSEKRLGFSSDIGVAFIGSPNVTMSANGTLASDPTFQNDLATERIQLEDDIKQFKFYPVFSFSIFYRF